MSKHSVMKGAHFWFLLADAVVVGGITAACFISGSTILVIAAVLAWIFLLIHFLVAFVATD